MVGIGSIHKRLYGTAETILTAVVVGLYLFPGCNDGYSIYDEGIAVYGAERVFHGQVPYRDFWTMYAPGQYYLLAFLFKLFGPSLMVERICSTVIATLVCTMTYAILRQSAGRAPAAMCTVLAAVWLGGLKFFGSPMPTALLLSLASTYGIVRYLDDRKCRWLAVCGLLVGAATLFRHDIGIYTLIAETSLITLAALGIGVKRRSNYRPLSLRSTLPFAALFGGFMLVVFPTALYFLIRVPFSELVADLITFPSAVYPHVRSLPFPLLWEEGGGNRSVAAAVRAALSPTNPSLPYYVPIVVYVVGLIYVVQTVRANFQRPWPKRLTVTLFFLVLGGLFFLQAIVRCDIHHFLPTFLPAIIVSGLIVSEFLSRFREGRKYFVTIAIILTVGISLVSVQRHAFLYRFRLIAESVTGRLHCQLPVNRAKGIRVDGDCSDYSELIAYVRDSLAPGEKVFVGTMRHDQIAKNDVLLYFLTDRECAIRYHELHPGVVTTDRVQQEIIAACESQHLRYIVRADLSGKEPNESAISSGVRLLDEYLDLNFSVEQRFGIYEIARRKVPRVINSSLAHNAKSK